MIAPTVNLNLTLNLKKLQELNFCARWTIKQGCFGAGGRGFLCKI